MKATNPFTGTVVREIENWTPEVLEKRIALTHRAQKMWKKTSMDTRVTLVKNLSIVLRQNAYEISEILTEEMGKRRVEAIAEVEKCADVCDYYAEHGPKYIKDEIIKSDAQLSYITYDAVGTVLAIMPWNYPMWQVFRYLAPTLIAGNTSLLKHSSKVPGVGIAIETIMEMAMAPMGVFQFLRVDTKSVGGIIRDPRINYVTLTGSEYAGSQVAKTCGEMLKKSVMELGGADPFIVLEDADIDAAVEAGVKSRFQNAGQVCIAAKRFIVVDAVREEFTKKFVAAVEQLQYGDPSETSTTLAPMVSMEARDEVVEMVRDIDPTGENTLTGGLPIDWCGMEATVIDNVSTDEKREIFGPVALIFRASDTEEAINIANDSPYGLSSSVWTKDVDLGDRVASKIEAGAVFINSMSKSCFELPFGGSKLSGFGRELGKIGIQEMCVIKTVYIK